MTSIATLPSYSELAKALKKGGSNFDASQVHGLICGLLCVTPEDQTDNSWTKRLFAAEKSPKDLGIFEELYEMTYHLLDDFSFEFNLILPSELKAISVRAEALGLWCQGFLAGIEQQSKFIAEQGSEDVKEALNDLIEIAQVSFDDESAKKEDDENAYFELVEYVRLCVLMIFQDIKSAKTDDQGTVQ